MWDRRFETDEPEDLVAGQMGAACVWGHGRGHAATDGTQHRRDEHGGLVLAAFLSEGSHDDAHDDR